MGTSKGVILVFDYNQNLKSIIGLGTEAVESGAVTSISISADHSTVAGGHASGHVFTWEFAKPAKPFLHIPPIDWEKRSGVDGHVANVAILHIGFLGSRHTALVSADDRGMAFSHLATRGMGAVLRTVKTTRILGRYPEISSAPTKKRKPSSVLAFSPLPLGNVTHMTDSMGFVAMLTPYLLVIVSTTPIAQTQFKTPRPKEVVAHSALTAALAWFPSVKLKKSNAASSETYSRVKLVYCWSNILTVLEVIEVEASSSSGQEDPPNLQFRPRSRWKAQEAIVAVQWIGRSVLAALTITQQLVILEDSSLRQTNSSDLIQKHVYHVDLFSQQLNMIVEQLNEEDMSMHGVVADAFYMSFRAYKGRLFLLGFNDVSFGTLSNWADRLLALMEHGSFIGAIELATAYYTGKTDKTSVGLPEDDGLRHEMVREKILEMMSASLEFSFGKDDNSGPARIDHPQLQELAVACISASVSIGDVDFLFDDVYARFQDGHAQGIFLEVLESFILEDDIQVLPPTVIKDLVDLYTSKGLDSRLEGMICRLDPRTMDMDQITALCKRNNLYDALIYVWSQGLDDHIAILNDLLDLSEGGESKGPNADPSLSMQRLASAQKVDPSLSIQRLASAQKLFPYLSYTLTGRIYPTGKEMSDEKGDMVKAEIYAFFFSGSRNALPNGHRLSPEHSPSENEISFPNLRRILDFDAANFLSMLNEAFEDTFLNDSHDHLIYTSTSLNEAQKFRHSVNRQQVVDILLDTMAPPSYEPEDTVYLHMFVARNLPKFPQFILLSGHKLHRVLTGLCQYPSDEIAEDCQLSVEYLLSMYQPPDLLSLVPLISKARFYRVLRSIYRSERQYEKLLETCFEEDRHNGDLVFECIVECLRPSTALSEKQSNEVRAVIRRNSYSLLAGSVNRVASTIDEYAPDLHEAMLQSLNEQAESFKTFEYLRAILDIAKDNENTSISTRAPLKRSFVETYVKLLCDYDPNHVTIFVEHLQRENLRLEEVLPALEDSGVVDAAIILIAREGQLQRAVDRLTDHLQTLEGALVGLLEGIMDSPDIANTSEAAQDLIASIHKFSRIGTWLCRGQTKPALQSWPQTGRKAQRSEDEEALTADETLWLDVISAVVAVTQNATQTLKAQVPDTDQRETNGADRFREAFDPLKLIVDLRTVVQETFTALLADTSTPQGTKARRTDVSFLKILGAFLNRASTSSPSLSNLRSVLSDIFSAYSYEESLLALSNQLLDKDLFIHVKEADSLRRRGWRPLGQVCEGCKRRVWGPGTGAYVWDAWQRANEERLAKKRDERVRSTVGDHHRGSSRNGKGKAVEDGETGGSAPSDDRRLKTNVANKGSTQSLENPQAGPNMEGTLVVFSCRHIFHRSCVEKMQGTDDAAQKDLVNNAGADFACPLCTTV